MLIERANTALSGTGVPLASTDATPVFMVPCEATEIAFDVVRRLRTLGFYACPSTFPAVPVNQPGVRFTMTRHNTLADVDDFVQALTQSFHEANEPATVPRSRSAPLHALP